MKRIIALVAAALLVAGYRKLDRLYAAAFNGSAHVDANGRRLH